jgi:hypothetical protein
MKVSLTLPKGNSNTGVVPPQIDGPAFADDPATFGQADAVGKTDTGPAVLIIAAIVAVFAFSGALPKE